MQELFYVWKRPAAKDREKERSSWNMTAGMFRYNARMDVYDFDGTLYQGDSTADFFLHCLRAYPRIAATLPRTGVAAAGCFLFHAIDKTRFKAALYRFIPRVPSVSYEVRRFWSLNECKLVGPCAPHEGDLVVSAGPEFLLRDVCAKRGLQLIASKVDPCTGHVLSPNCSDAEKIARLYERFPDVRIEHFYSDSLNDAPLAGLADKAFFVKKGVIEPCPRYTISGSTGPYLRCPQCHR